MSKHQPLNDALAGKLYADGQRLAAGVTIQRSPHDLYTAWKSFEDLPRFIDDLESVTREGQTLRWQVKGPGGKSFSWEARIINETPDALIAWRTTDEGVPNAGSITFRALPFHRGTEVRVVIDYLPPGGGVGAKLAAASGHSPDKLLRRGLFRFRQLMESREIATSDNQPAGSNPTRKDRPDEEPRKSDGDVRDLASPSPDAPAGEKGAHP